MARLDRHPVAAVHVLPPRAGPEVERHGLDAHLVRVDGLRGTVGGGRKAAYLRPHLAALDSTGRRLVLIGDSVDDGEAADVARRPCVLYAGGFTDLARLRRPACRSRTRCSKPSRWRRHERAGAQRRSANHGCRVELRPAPQRSGGDGMSGPERSGGLRIMGAGWSSGRRRSAAGAAPSRARSAAEVCESWVQGGAQAGAGAQRRRRREPTSCCRGRCGAAAGGSGAAAHRERPHGRRGGRRRPERSSRRSSNTGPTSRSSTFGCRRHTPTRACAPPSRPAGGCPAPRPGALAIRRGVLRRRPARRPRWGVGYLLKDRVSDVADFLDGLQRVGDRRHRARPGGRRPAAGPPPPRRPAAQRSPRGSGRCWG